MNSYLKLTLSALLIIATAACGANQNNTNSQNDTATMEGDTSLMDTPMSTGSGTDTIEQKLKEGEDGTGKPSTDPRTRKQL